MSGICGLLRLGGEAVDSDLLTRLTQSLAFRGPDAQLTWSEGSIGFGHALLRTRAAQDEEHQPASLDGQVWITADARIDGTAALRASLSAKGVRADDVVGDAALVLLAYRCWGEDCVHHLIGDFSFAIWDGPRRRLLCVRDQMGVRPFFFAVSPKGFAFSNTLDCLHVHPEVTRSLDEKWIGDFLLFEASQDPAATAYADIRRLPPGHCLSLSPEGMRIWRYWSVPTDVPILARSDKECVEEFQRILDEAVADRLHSGRVVVEMTGGMDSSSLAAIAKSMLATTGRPFDLRACTLVYDSLIPDEERYYSGLVAEALGIEQVVCVADGYDLFERHEEAVAHTAEPFHDPTAIRGLDLMRSLPADFRVVLTGWDGDALLAEAPGTWFRWLWARRKLAQLGLSLTDYAIRQVRQRPSSWRRWIARGFRRARTPASTYPAWLDPEFESRIGLRARHAEIEAKALPSHMHRPYLVRVLTSVQESSDFFETFDAGQTRLPREYRHPFMDLRLINFVLSLPPYPWCFKKHLLREAMRGRLPEPVRRRRKTPLAGDPHLKLIAAGRQRPFDSQLVSPALRRYIDPVALRAGGAPDDDAVAWSNLRPISLAYWLARNPELQD